VKKHNVAFLLLAVITGVVFGFPNSSGAVARIFQYNGKEYEWSTAYAEDRWADIIPGYTGTVNESPDGDAGEKGQAWCQQLTGESGWFIPNLEEARAARDAGILDDMEAPEMCGPIVGNGIPQLWTSTTADYWRRAYALHSLSVNVDDKNATDIAECTNWGDTHWCEWRKWHYYGHHWCPLARCVRIVGNEPRPTIAPSPTPTKVIPTPFQLHLPLVLRQ